ncbi:MAG: hypothetical protein Kow0069_11030 [Promethearchaeota archaeon]
MEGNVTNALEPNQAQVAQSRAWTNSSISWLARSGGFPLLLRAALDRVPVVIACDEAGVASSTRDLLLALLSFRTPLAFPGELADAEQADSVLYVEKEDPYGKRATFTCRPRDAKAAVETFGDFTGWILPTVKRDAEFVNAHLSKRADPYVTCEVNERRKNLKCSAHGKRRAEVADASHEKRLVLEAAAKTDKALESIRAALEGNENGAGSRGPLDLDLERAEVQTRLLSRALGNFHAACLVAYTIYLKAEYLNNLGLSTSFSDATVLSVMNYDAPIERVNYFIAREWFVDFASLVDKSRVKRFEDRVRSAF